MFFNVAMVATSVCAFAQSSSSQGAAVSKSDVSHSAPTEMEPYTVEESPSTKTHTLFMGADIAINLDKDQYRVQDVTGSNWVIDINGRKREISAKRAPVDLKITPGLKLTENSAMIVGLIKMPGYSFENDPNVKLTKGMTAAAISNSNLQAMAQNAQNVADTASQHTGLAALAAGTWNQFGEAALEQQAQYAGSNSRPTTVGPGGLPNPSALAPSATNGTTGNNAIPGYLPSLQNTYKADFQTTAANLNDAMTQAAANSAAAQTGNGYETSGKLASAGMDALDVTFSIRSGKPLHNPYVVTMTRFRTPGSKPGMVQNMVYAKALDPIDEHLMHVHFEEDGFPFGYEVVDFQLHIYDRGEEIATNVASDRVELTRDEAFEYVKMEYMGAHQKDTLPPVPAMGRLPADLHVKLVEGLYAKPVYVRVSPDGLADAAYSDAACTQRIEDPYLDSVVRRIRFKPALRNGSPVQGLATLDLRKLAI